MTSRHFALTLTLLVTSACADQSVPSAARSIGPIQSTFSPNTAPIPGRYIVQFKKTVVNAASMAKTMAVAHAGVLEYTYTSAFKGMTMSMSAAKAAAMASDPSVLSVEQDQIVTVASIQSGASWGLDRIDQRALPLNGGYNYANTGSGVTIYFIDSGIDFTHHEFGGRASPGADILTPGGSAADCMGHGTETAAVAGGATFGVAKQAKLVAVRVFDCVGGSTTSILLAGVDWVTAHRVLPAVANMSVSASYSAALNQAVATSIASGIQYVVAAGNRTANACNYSPSSVANAIVVGATASNDGLATYSNFGACVSLNAPGSYIPTASYHSDTASTLITGTSASAPFTAGAAALYLQGNPGMSPAQLKAALVSSATANVLSGVPTGTPNRLLYIGNTGTPPPPPINHPPVARFVASCPTLLCSFDASRSTDDVGIVTYTWSWGNGQSESHTTPTASHSFATGVYGVTLTVTDAGALSSSMTVQLPVPTATANRAPISSIIAPATNSTFAQGTTVTFTGTGSDAEDGTLTGASLVWTSSRDGTIGTGASFATGTLSVGTHTITLTASDKQHATSTSTVTITITPVSVNQPPVARFTFACATGIAHQCTFDASTSSDNVGVTSYNWSWGNGRGESHPTASAKNTWAAAGTENVTLTVTDGAGLTSTVTHAIPVP